jgi:hypothetical protein
MALFTRAMTTDVVEEEEELPMPTTPGVPVTPGAPEAEVTGLPGVSPITPGFGVHDITDIPPPDISGYDMEEPSVIDQAAEEEQIDQAEREREEKEREEELVPVESWSERSVFCALSRASERH